MTHVNSAGKVEVRGTIPRLWRFLRKSPEERARSFYARWIRLFPKIPMPVHLPFGAWWLAGNDFIGWSLFYGGFENRESSFVGRFLRPGMVVLDIGAHHGYYTLLASKLAGSRGKVFSFEPSPRERRRLLLHKRLNRCGNVSVQALALGDQERESELHVAEDAQSGHNSLMPPAVTSETSRVRVRVARLDNWLQDQDIDHVDFIKMDVEGGELAVLHGATRLLERQPRPVFLVEVQDIRTQPWGYPAKEIIQLLRAKGFRWFSPGVDGGLEDLDASQNSFDGNFVALPEELEAKCPIVNSTRNSFDAGTAAI